jgi:aldehyde:ferredoxin oxidoreductase
VTNIRGGFMGSILDVDLTTGDISTYDISDDDRRLFLGGKILAAKILWDNLEPGIDPLSPDNLMVFTAGTFNGAPLPSSSRFNCSTRNVLTGGIASSNCGGDFGTWMRKAGYDGLILRGRAPQPTWLEITEDEVTLHDATDLWGKNIEEVQETLAKDVRELVIGPGGENLVRFAAILSGDRAFGRCGVGAVMGSKNLKLVTAKGRKKLPIADRDRLKEVSKRWTKALQNHSITGKQLPKYGTAGLVNITNATHTLCTRNFQRGHWEHADDVSGETMAETILVKNGGCRTCPIRCGRVVEYKGRNIKGPEFETIGMFGPSMQNRELKKIVEWNYLADIWGLDTISLGSTIACAMELKERGLLDDLPVAFDDHEAIPQLIEDIALRRGIGDRLAEGSARLAADVGQPGLSMSAKGMEFAAYEPRNAVGHGLGYAVSNRGGCHINGGYLVYFEALGPVNMDPLTPKAKPAYNVFQQNMFEVVSGVGNCIFTTYAVIPDTPDWAYNPAGLSAKIASKALVASRVAVNHLSKLRPGALPIHYPDIPQSAALEALTGERYRLGDVMVAGERGFTLERMINLREGLLGETDALPPRLTDVPERADEPRSRVPLDEMKPVYYKVRDWDTAGIPNRSLLTKLGLDFTLGDADKLRSNPGTFRDRAHAVKENEDQARADAQAAIGVSK